jgi:hypothetical protein
MTKGAGPCRLRIIPFALCFATAICKNLATPAILLTRGLVCPFSQLTIVSSLHPIISGHLHLRRQ